MPLTLERRRRLDRIKERLLVAVEVMKIALVLAAAHFCFVAANVVVRLYNETRMQGATLDSIKADVARIANKGAK